MTDRDIRPVGRGAWMKTYTGRKFYLFDPRPEDVCVEDLAHHLAYQCRYAGATSRYYSVAEHCVLVSMHVAPAHQREALLHDSAEAYIGDMIRPLKHEPQMAPFCALEGPIENAVLARFGVVSTQESRAAIKAVDDGIILDETRELMPHPDDYLQRHPAAVAPGACVVGLSPERAELIFMLRFVELFGPEDMP